MTKWRNRVGDKLEALLKEIVTVAIETKALKRHAVKHVNVDTTVHEKAIAFPTDARLVSQDAGHVSAEPTNITFLCAKALRK